MTIRIKDYYERAFELRDGASLAFFRILLGILLLRDVPTFIYIGRQTLEGFRSSYYGFEWLQPDQPLITLGVHILPLAVLCVILGLFYRLAMPLTTLIVGYFFLIAPEYYLNHYYMLLLFCVLMSFIPAHRTWSVDSRVWKEEQAVPVWSYWILKLQTEVILIYAGLVKINPDWLNLQPLGTWLKKGLYDVPFLGMFFFFDPVIAIGAYGVIALHLIGAPLLFWDRARPWVFALYCCFHLSNSVIFNIGIFPYLTIGATLLFFNPDWPRRFVDKLALSELSFKVPFKVPKAAIISFLVCWMVFQIMNPLQNLFASNLKTKWTGHRDTFTWRMMLNNRSVHTVSFAVYIPEQRRVEFVPLKEHLSAPQYYLVTARPNSLVEFAHYLEGVYREKYSVETIEVHAYITTSINFRDPEIWADPKVNLAAYKPKYGVHEWIMPINNPLRSLEEMTTAPRYTHPTYREILRAMGLPEDAAVIFDGEPLSLDTTFERLEWDKKW